MEGLLVGFDTIRVPRCSILKVISPEKERLCGILLRASFRVDAIQNQRPSGLSLGRADTARPDSR